MSNKHHHLELIQAVIARMGSNLFLLKGWTVTLIVGLYALGSRDTNPAIFYFAYVPTALFWCLDGYFLSLERRFRALYDDVRKLPEDKIDFSMDVSSYAQAPRASWVSSMLAPSLLLYYGGLTVTVLIVVCTSTR